MIKHIATLALFTSFCTGAFAQSVSEAEILRAVEAYSPALKSYSASAQSMRLEARTGNTLPNPEVEYTRLWSSSQAVAENEFTAKQGFDFPTAYRYRNQAARAKIQSADAAYRGQRIGELLQARLLVREILYQQKRKTVDSLRLSNAIFAREVAEERAEAGDITAIEENKIQFEILSARNSLIRTRMALSTALTRLSTMTGIALPESVSLDPLPLPPLGTFEQAQEKAFSLDPSLAGAQAAQQEAEAGRKLAAALALPKFSAGYKYSNAEGISFNGLIAGMTIPIFESRNTVRLARARLAEFSAVSQALNASLQSDVAAKYRQAKSLEGMYDLYQDNGDTFDKSSLLKKALDEGTMTILEYFIELDAVYKNMDESNEVEYNYACLVIELDKYSA